MPAFLPLTPARRPRSHRALTSAAVLAAALFGPACNDATAPNSLVPSPLFTIVSGNGQTAAAGKELAQPIVAQVTNSSGAPIAGVTIFFVVTNGGGKLYAGGGVTNSSGHVQDYWTLGPVAGQTQRVQVRAVDPTTGNKELYGTFSATAVAGPAAIIKVHAGDGQTAFTRAVLPIKPAVMVTDALGNRVAGVSVTFAVAPGGGSISGGSGITNTNGTATVGGWRLGRAPGTQRLTATSSGLTGSPVTFTATAKFGMSLVTTGRNFSCGLSAGNDVYCWGINDVGEIGDGTQTDRHAPVRSAAGLLPSSLALAQAHSCALLSTGKAHCWGYNAFGQLGDGTNNTSLTPVAVSGTQSFTSIAAASHTTCGLTSAGAVWCWGSNSNGEFGNNGTADSNVPVEGATGGITFKSIYRGRSHTCALTPSGNAWCWGANGSGQLGDGSIVNSLTPKLVTGSLMFTSLEAGLNHTCGLVAGGKAYCWGANADGQLGDLGTANASAPTAVHGGIAFTQLAAADAHTCGITSTGDAYCWGSNTNGELGIGTVGASSTIPTLVAGSRSFSAIYAGTGPHTCALPAGGGSPYCWGNNASGQLGNGTVLDSSLPVEVRTPAIP